MKPLLPEGYYFAADSSISAEEIISLRQSVGWSAGNPQIWIDCLRQSLAVVGVRNSDQLLVGIGFLAGNHRHAILCDFTVHPDHQKRGIGKAILQMRINKAEELKIPYLYTSLNPKNSLRKLYQSLGFECSGNEFFRGNV